MESENPPDKDGGTGEKPEEPKLSQAAGLNVPDTRTIATEPHTPVLKKTLDGEPSTSASYTLSTRRYRHLYHETRIKYDELKINFDAQKQEHMKAKKENDAVIKEMREKCEKPCVVKLNNEDAFVSKPRKNARGEQESNGCEVSGCASTNVDLIKCSQCGHLICEECSGVKVSKLRPIMNACSRIYITCPTCDVLVRDSSTMNIIDHLKEKIEVLKEELDKSEKESDKLKEDCRKHQSDASELRTRIGAIEKENSDQSMKIKMQGGVIQQMQAKEKQSDVTEIGTGKHETNIDAKFEAFSANILSKVTEIMDRKIGEISKVSTPSQASPSTPSPVSWSSVVSQSSDMQTVMRTARNNEKIEEGEKQRRANNIILHGAEEIGDTPDDIKKADTGYIKEIFAKIGAEVEPSSIVRLGAPKEDGNRPLKLVMKSKEDKEMVMNNLGKLKNTERLFGKISLKMTIPQTKENRLEC